MNNPFYLATPYLGFILLSLAVLSVSGLSSPEDSVPSFHWTPQSTPTTASLRGLSVVSGQVAWASGSEGTCLRTTDGGTTWQKCAIPNTDSVDFRDVEAFSADEAFALSAGEPALLYHTTDGGQTWQLRYENHTPGIFLDALEFWDTTHGVAMGDPLDGHFVLVATHDGGQHWKSLPTDHMPPPVPGEAGFAASGTGITTFGSQDAWLATGGARARVFYSDNQGRRWQVADTPMQQGSASQGIFSIVRTAARRGVAVGGNYLQPSDTSGTACFTEDGGQTWQLPRSFPRGYRSAVAYQADSELLLAVGPTGSDYSVDQGRSWQPVDTVGYHAVQLAPNQRVGWAVGSDGRIARVRW